MRQSIARKREIPKNSLVSMIAYWLRNAGLWKDVSQTKIHWLTKVAMSIFLSTVVLQIIDLFMAKNDPERLFECFSVFTFCGMGALKLYTIVGSHERWLSLISHVDELENHQLNTDQVFDVEYDTDDDSNEDLHPKYIQKYTTRFQSIAVLLNRIYRSTLVIFIFSPFAEYGFWRISGQSVPHPHILTSWAWAPSDDVYFVGYAGTVVFEAISAVYCVFVHIAFDLTTVALMIFICGQFELLRNNSERIGGSGKNCNVSKKRDDRAHFRIIKCHTTHILLVKSITELNQLVKDILGVYFLVTTLTLCSVAVRLNTEDLSIMQLLSLLQYMCATLTQLYLFCHYGDGLFHESSVNMGEGPFGSAYWCLSPKIRRELTLLSIGLCQKRCIKAGPFNSLDLPTFIKVLKTAYSYYAVLRK